MAAISSTENMAGTPESVGGLAEAFRPPSHHLQHHTPHHPSQGGGSGDLLLGEDEGGGGDGPLTPEMDGLQVRKYCKNCTNRFSDVPALLLPELFKNQGINPDLIHNKLRVGIGLSDRPSRLHRLAESIPGLR